MDPKRKTNVLITIVLVLAVALACQLVGGQGGEAPAEETAPTEPPAPTETVDTQATADAQSTQEAQSTADAQAAADAQATATAEFKKTQAVLDKQATLTQAFALKQTSTAEAVLEETAQAQPMFELLEQLIAEGYLESTAVEYYPLETFDESQAKLGHGTYWRTGLEGESFVLSGHVKLMSASDKANWSKASCGIIFGEEDEDNYNLVDIAMDGFLYSWDVRNNNFRAIAYKNYGPPMVPQGEADIVLVVSGQQYHFFVDGREILSATNLRLKPGNIALLMRSGSNKDYGTRCIMDNLGVWLIQ